jgi:hypothetical protein
LLIHNSKLATIEEKGLLNCKTKAFDQAKILRETKFNEKLAALGKNEKAENYVKALRHLNL